MGGGFVDFYLEPFFACYPDMGFDYLIELKYIKRSEFYAETLQEKVSEAETQLRKYANDPRIVAVARQTTLKSLILVYRGWELVYRDEAKV